MTVNTETLSKSANQEDMKVGGSWTGEIKLSFGDCAFYFSPKDAVEVWRVMKGEKEDALVRYNRNGLIGRAGCAHVWYKEGDGKFLWRIRFEDDFCVVLDANEALALSWAIEGQVSMEIWGVRNSAIADNAPDCVWVLSCRRLLSGDCAETVDSERIGGHEEVFLSKDSAMENLREFIRPLVNDAYSDSFWDNSGRNVDDVLDDITSECFVVSGSASWRHDGQTQSFEVVLSRREVRR